MGSVMDQSRPWERDDDQPLYDKIYRLTAELEHFTKSGIVEIAVRNQSVADYMQHWEGRAEKAEATLAERDAEIARLREALGKALNALVNVYESDGLLVDELAAFNAARAALQEQRG